MDQDRGFDPDRHVVWCERCQRQRWTRYGRPYGAAYVMVTPGRFTHRLCAVQR